MKRSLFCSIASARRWMVTASALAVVAGSAGISPALARSRDQVGDIVSRPAVQLPETALTTIQHSRETVRQRLDAIAAQADPLADALDKYKKNPSPQTAIQLLHREAVVAGIGASESEKIASEAGTVARTCAELAAQCGRQIEMLGGDAAKASRAQAEYDTARNVGLGELRDLHRSLVERGATNDALIPPAERRNISRLLQLYGAADLAERFVRMEANANQAVLGKLKRWAINLPPGNTTSKTSVPPTGCTLSLSRRSVAVLAGWHTSSKSVNDSMRNRSLPPNCSRNWVTLTTSSPRLLTRLPDDSVAGVRALAHASNAGRE